ncbi:MAG TPA: phenylalanine--tRNA ligase subunit alpha [Candidatus Omnitrophota bacterium]|nr:phenylalanine--tRNA ligase subunit alpha [Candidatus Omnitrophota bacterium]
MDAKKIINSLSPNELKILPHLEDKNIVSISKKSNLDKTSVLRALEFLKNKGIAELAYEKKKIIDLGVNGILYRKKGLPERRLLQFLEERKIISLEEAQKQSRLSEDEFRVSLGILKRKSFIGIKNNKIILNQGERELAKKMPEEIFIENLPLNEEKLSEEQKQIFRELLKRKEIIKVAEERETEIKVTELGKSIIKSGLKSESLIEQITPDIIKSDKLWKGKKFRVYDILSRVPEISGGKRHFVNQAADYARDVWTELGFKEMTGDMIVSSFWNFDALFTAQDHPVREMQDTFFLNKKTNLPDKEIVKRVKESHEKGVDKSRGWQYNWSDEEAKKLVLRTHTTCLSAQTLSKLKVSDLPQKFFALGKCFRNETVDWSHGFEFNQTEGIVIDRNANFRHLLGYLKEFFKKMGFEKIRFRPSYFPYTEPSVEIDVFHPEKKIWLELGGAGIFRPEVTIPLMGENVPVLAWGPGFDRILMDYYQIKDLRELYKNDISQLRKIKFWIKA